jgi:hypothetical protein
MGLGRVTEHGGSLPLQSERWLDRVTWSSAARGWTVAGFRRADGECGRLERAFQFPRADRSPETCILEQAMRDGAFQTMRVHS